jgi:hypothetical protein
MDLSIQMAAVRERLTQGGEPMLPFLNFWFITEAMFKEEEAPARLQNPMNLVKRLIDIFDAAEGPGADGGIE